MTQINSKMEFYGKCGQVLLLVLCISQATVSAQKPPQNPLFSRSLHKSPNVGGSSGLAFDDVETFNKAGSSPITDITSVSVSSKDFIESFQVSYKLANFSYFQTSVRGTPQDPVVFDLEYGEYISLVEGSSNGLVVTELKITTTKTDGSLNVYGPFGTSGSVPFSISGMVIGFYGKYDTYLNSLGIHYFDCLKKSEEYGVRSGQSKFDDSSDVSNPPVVGIANITLWHGDWLNGIQVDYMLLGGKVLQGKLHGGNGSTLTTTISLKKGEKISNATFGHTKNSGSISKLMLSVKRIRGYVEVVGPFGGTGSIFYSVVGNILGFYGHSESYVDRLGFYYEP